MKTLNLQPIPYQGSKRRIAEKIMRHAPKNVQRIVEPFAGSAAITLYSAHHKVADRFLINDSFEPLMQLWNLIINEPEKCAANYEKIWLAQHADPQDHYMKIREDFNKDGDPTKFLFLIARCAKNAIRFNTKGEFNQSPDKRRLGRRPSEMRKQILATSFLLRRKTEIITADYEDVLKSTNTNDLVYMDPPYQGTSNTKNPRYHQGLELGRFIKNLEDLVDRNIPFILSFDGQLGEKIYGEPLPDHLGLYRIPVHAGWSAQSTLNGKKEKTIESLYLTKKLAEAFAIPPQVQAFS